MQSTTTLLHLTLNTGHIARTSGITPSAELAAVQSLLERGGPIPTRDPFWVGLDPRRGCASFCLYHRKLPLTMNLVAWEDTAARQAWPEIEFFYQKLDDLSAGTGATRACPARPKATPWLATLILPTLALTGQTLDEMAWVAAFERIYAEALLAKVAA